MADGATASTAASDSAAAVAAPTTTTAAAAVPPEATGELAAAATTTEILPQSTLYVNNLNEKVKVDELKRALYAFFGAHGPVLEVVATKHYHTRGQAWVVFRDLASAVAAMRQLNGYQFYDKPMRIQFAKAKSDAVSKLDGTFKEREKKKPAEKRRPDEGTHGKDRKSKRLDNKPDRAPLVPGPEGLAASALPAPRPNPPNHKLLVEGLPEQANESMLTALFQQFGGFKVVRIAPVASGRVAFVEYDSEPQATTAMSSLQHFKLTPTHPILVSYAKRAT